MTSDGAAQRRDVDEAFAQGSDVHGSDVRRADVVVVGGGLAGLVAGATAARAGARVVVVDPTASGGRAATDERQGYLLNRGAHALYRGGPAERVLDELGVRRRGSAPPSSGLHATRDGRVHLLPAGATSLARTTLLGLRSKARLGALLARLPRLRPAELTGTPVDGFLADAALPDDAAQLVRALVRLSSYAHCPDRHDAGAAVAQLQAALAHGVLYLDGGWRTLVDGIARSGGAGLTVRPASAVSIEAEPGSAVVHLAGGGQVEAAAVVVAAGTPTACAGLLGDTAPGAWAGIDLESAVSCLDLGLRRLPSRRSVLGIDQPLYLSHHSPPARLAPPGRFLCSTMRYLAPGERLDPGEAKAALRAHAAAAGVRDDDIELERALHRQVVCAGLPAAAAGGSPGRPGVDAGGGILVAGDWVGPEGQLADAAFASGADAGRRAARAALRHPVG